MSKVLKTKKKENHSKVEPEGDEIAKRAYLIWELDNYCHGKDVENWLRAEQELNDEKTGGKGS